MDKGRADFLDVGDWNVSCYECGRKRKASEMVKHWQGYYVCARHNEPRHPQDYARAVQDVQTPPWTQDRPDPLFIGAYIPGSGNDPDIFLRNCTNNGVSAVPGQAVPGCMVPGYLSSDYE